jgi:hypothetical protein
MNLDRTRKLVLAGVWSDAALVMAASAWNGGHVLQVMGDPAGFGTLLGLAVDVGLAVALIGDRTLHLAGKSEPWSRWVRNVTAAMSLGLNCAVPLHDHHWGQMMFHAFLPILLVLLSEYAQKLTLQFRAILDDQVAQEHANREAQRVAEQARIDAERREHAEIEMRRARGELVTAQDALDKASKLHEQAREERAQADREVAELARLRERIGQRESKPHDVVPTPRPRRPKTTAPAGKAKSGPTKHEECKAYVMAELIAGRSPKGAELDRQFGLPRSTGARIIHAAEDQLRRTKLHVVEG